MLPESISPSAHSSASAPSSNATAPSTQASVSTPAMPSTPNLPASPSVNVSTPSTSESTFEPFLVKVLKVTQEQNQQFTLHTQGRNGQLAVKSEHPLPVGTELKLQAQLIATASSAATQTTAPTNLATTLKVLEIYLPKTPEALAPAVQKLAKENILQQLVQPFLAARLTAQESSAPPRQADVYSKALLNYAQANNGQINSSQTANPARAAAPSALLQLLQNLPTAHSTATHSAASTASPTSNPMPPVVQTLLQQWVQSLPTSEQLSQGDAVRQSVQNSGLFFENKLLALLQPHLAKALNSTSFAAHVPEKIKQFFTELAQQAPKPTAPAPTQNATSEAELKQQVNLANPERGQAIKSILELVKARLEAPTPPLPSPPSLLQSLLATDAKPVLSRALLIWANHSQFLLNTAPQATTDNQHPAFKLLQNALSQLEGEQGRLGLQQQTAGQNLQLHIPLLFQHQQQLQEVRVFLEEDAQQDSAAAKKQSIRWRLRLHFNLQTLGPLDVDLELQFPKIKASFWSKQSETLALLNQELQPLRKHLTQLGAEVEDLKVLHGQLPEPIRNRIEQRLVDVHS